MRKIVLATMIGLILLASSTLCQDPSSPDYEGPEEEIKESESVCAKAQMGGKNKCSSDTFCIKCTSCKGGRISKGWVAIPKDAKEEDLKTGSFACLTIWVWLGPVLAVVIIGGGIGAWCFMKNRKTA